MHLNIGQIRFFLRKQEEETAREEKSKELNAKLRAQAEERRKREQS